MLASLGTFRRCFALAVAVALTACSHHRGTVPGSPKGTVSGTVSAASGTIAGASVTLYAPGGGKLGSATSSSSGTFTVSYESGASFFYVVSEGGTPTGATSANKALRLMTVVSTSATSGVTVNELTTVACAFAFAHLLNGTTVTSVTPGTQNAAQTVFNLVTSTGGVASVLANTPNGTATEALPLVDTLADLVAQCVSGGSSSCSSFLAAATPSGGSTPGNTLDALVAIAKHPTSNVSRIFGLLSGTPAYSPALTSAPNAWTLALAYANGGLAAPTGIAIDAMGDPWILNQFQPGTTSPANGITVLDPTGNALYGSPIVAGGIDGPQFGIAIDQQQNVWVSNTFGNDFSEFSATDGTANTSSPFSGSGLTGPQGAAVDTQGNVFFALEGAAAVLEFQTGNPNTAIEVTGGGLASPYGVATDTTDNVWVTNATSSGSVTEIDTTGNVTANSPITGGGLSTPRGIATDASGNVWVANSTGASVTEINSTGGFVSGSPYRTGTMKSPWGIALDADGVVWVADFGAASLFAICGSNASLCPSGGHTGAFISPTNGFTSGALKYPQGIAIDGAGNVWLTDNASAVSGNSFQAGTTVTEFIGLGQPTLTPTIGAPQKS